MSKAICTGGMGKNPAIEKINQLNETSSRSVGKEGFCRRKRTRRRKYSTQKEANRG